LIKTRIAKRYARALFEIAKEAGSIEEYGRDLGVVHTLYVSDASIRNGLTTVIVGYEAKVALLDAVIEAAGLDRTVGNFLKVLLDAGKMGVLPQVVEEYSSLADAATGKLRGEVTAPMALDGEAVAKLSAALSKALGKQVILESHEDTALIGGVVARVGNLVFDASVRTQIQRMKESLLKG